MSKKQPLDMTRGNPLPILVRFAIPLILGSLFQQLYSFVDTAIVGRCVGLCMHYIPKSACAFTQ